MNPVFRRLDWEKMVDESRKRLFKDYHCMVTHPEPQFKIHTIT